MRPVSTDVLTLRGLCCVLGTRSALCKDGWTDRDVVWGGGKLEWTRGRKERVFDEGALWVCETVERPSVPSIDSRRRRSAAGACNVMLCLLASRSRLYGCGHIDSIAFLLRESGYLASL